MSAEPAAKRLKLDGEADVTEDAAPEHVLPSLPEEANQLLTDCLADLAKVRTQCDLSLCWPNANKWRMILCVESTAVYARLPQTVRRSMMNAAMRCCVLSTSITRSASLCT